MDEPKILIGLDCDDYEYPLADVSNLSGEEKKDLLHRGMQRPKQLRSDEELEQWVTLFSELNTYNHGDDYEPTAEDVERERMMTASYQRGLWYHGKRFNEWKKKHLQPLIDELTEHAAHDPQYDWQYIYELEYAKLRCMRAYFSHSLIADEDGNFGFNRWIDICISLLRHLMNDGINISEKQIGQMNVRNVGDIVSQRTIENYEDAPIQQDVEYGLPD